MDPFIGEIKMVAFPFPPMGWMLCNGQVLQISQNQALFALIGTTYGGDGRTTFQLPDLQGRVALGAGAGAGLPNYTIGEKAGSPSVTLLATNLPSHTHTIATPVSNAAGTSGSPAGAYPAALTTTVAPSTLRATAATEGYAAAPVAGQTAAPYQSGVVGNGLPVSIEPPYLAVYFIIAVQGIFPTRQ